MAPVQLKTTLLLLFSCISSVTTFASFFTTGNSGVKDVIDHINIRIFDIIQCLFGHRTKKLTDCMNNTVIKFDPFLYRLHDGEMQQKLGRAHQQSLGDFDGVDV